tara:strand:+ start:8801 stop:9025 length:225 start_codon:yes stop_codon:yes gene_type:complete
MLIDSLKSNIPNKIEIDIVILQQMSFIFNALQDGWKVEKKRGKYIFKKPHEGVKEVFLESYLKEFIESNISKLS